jgi:hypothetical protein
LLELLPGSFYNDHQQYYTRYPIGSITHLVFLLAGVEFQGEDQETENDPDQVVTNSQIDE